MIRSLAAILVCLVASSSAWSQIPKAILGTRTPANGIPVLQLPANVPATVAGVNNYLVKEMFEAPTEVDSKLLEEALKRLKECDLGVEEDTKALQSNYTPNTADAAIVLIGDRPHIYVPAATADPCDLLFQNRIIPEKILTPFPTFPTTGEYEMLLAPRGEYAYKINPPPVGFNSTVKSLMEDYLRMLREKYGNAEPMSAPAQLIPVNPQDLDI